MSVGHIDLIVLHGFTQCSEFYQLYLSMATLLVTVSGTFSLGYSFCFVLNDYLINSIAVITFDLFVIIIIILHTSITKK